MSVFIENFFGTLASVTSIISLLPQVYKSYVTKSTRDLSMLFLINCIVCAVAWVVYGIMTSSNFVVYSNIFFFIVTVISIAQKICYDKKQRDA